MIFGKKNKSGNRSIFIKHFKRCFFLVLKKVIFIEDIRCPYCNQLLLKAEKVKGEIKCLRCKNIVKLDKDRA